MSKALKEAGWRLVLPEIRQIVKEEIQSAMGEINAKFEGLNMKFEAVNSRIDAVNETTASMRNELKAEISRVESKVVTLTSVST